MKQFFSWRSAVLDSDLQSSTKLVLLVISTYMNDHGGGAYPSQNTIVNKSSLSKRTVVDHIEIACNAGWLIKDTHGFSGQGWRRNEYKIAFPDVIIDGDDEGGAVIAPRQKVVQPLHKGGANNSTKVVQPLHLNNCKELFKGTTVKENQKNEGTKPINFKKTKQSSGDNNRRIRAGSDASIDGARIAINRRRTQKQE